MREILYTRITEELAALNGYAVPVVGEENVRRNDGPPRMILFPTPQADTFGPPEGIGGNPKSLATVLEASACVIFGESREICEGMRDQFLIALHRACKKASSGTVRAGRYQIGRMGFETNAVLAKNGFKYTIAFLVAVPVVARKWSAPTQQPDASTYTGTQADTYPTAPVDEIDVSVGNATNADPVQIQIRKP